MIIPGSAYTRTQPSLPGGLIPAGKRRPAARQFRLRGIATDGPQFRLVGVVLLAAAMCAGAQSAAAQHAAEPLKLQPMNFDMWCQETERLAPDRCDRRIPSDDAAFQAFSNNIETYEMRNQRGLERYLEIDRDIVHYDPVDHPTEFSAPQADRPNYDN